MPERRQTEMENVPIRRSYIRVLVVWVVTLAGLYLLQAYFQANLG